MSDELREFMATGIERYPEAFAAVDRFQSEIYRMISETLKSRSQWSDFVPTRDPNTTAGGSPGKGCWIYATYVGKIYDAGISLELGLWWDAPQHSKLVAYAAPSSWSAKALKALQRATPLHPVRVASIDSKDRFTLEISAEVNLPTQIAQLMDELTKFLTEYDWISGSLK